MVCQFLFFCILLFNIYLCRGHETESQIIGPRYVIVKPKEYSSAGITHKYPQFSESVFEKMLIAGKWRYQSLLEDNSTGYCGYCKDEDSQWKQYDTYLVKSVIKGGDKLKFFHTRFNGGVSNDPVDVSMTPVPGKVKLILANTLTSRYSGQYNITRHLYNGVQQYQKTQDGPRIYVNIYNQWVIGTWDHTDKIILNQVEASPNFTSKWLGWTKSWEYVKGSDSVVTLSTEKELRKSLGQPPECIISQDLFKLTTEGTYRILEVEDSFNRVYTRLTDGLWAQYLGKDFNDDSLINLRTSESSTVIPRSGWGIWTMDYAPDIGNTGGFWKKWDIATIIGSPCVINLQLNNLSKYSGAYGIEKKLENDHPVYTRDNKFSLYVNSSKKWVLGRIVENQSGTKTKKDVLILSQDLSTTPLTWPEWQNNGTQQNPVMVPRQV